MLVLEEIEMVTVSREVLMPNMRTPIIKREAPTPRIHKCVASPPENRGSSTRGFVGAL